MNVDEARKILKTQIELERTPKGRPLTREAILNLDATLSHNETLGEDERAGNAVIRCAGCGMVTSMLLVEKGCPNCGCLLLKTDIGV
jgi:hypothetical protein